jgi:hypothetical protein
MSIDLVKSKREETEHRFRHVLLTWIADLAFSETKVVSTEEDPKGFQALKAPEVVPEESKAPEVVPEESKAPEVVPEESKAPEVVPEESKAPELVPEESKAPEVMPEDSAAEDSAEEEESPQAARFEAKYGSYMACGACRRSRPTCDFYDTLCRREEKGLRLAPPNCDLHTSLNDAVNCFVNPQFHWKGLSEERLTWLKRKEQKYREKRTPLVTAMRLAEGDEGNAHRRRLAKLERKKAKDMVELYEERLALSKGNGWKRSLLSAQKELAKWQSRL